MNSTNPTVEVYILSYNRPEYILQALDSVLNQTYSNLKVIVSDNSSNDDVEQKIIEYNRHSEFSYVRRKPSLPALSHFNKIFSEVTADYFVVFHDDDVMLPEAIEKLVTAITKDLSLSAVAGNATIIEYNDPTKLLFNSKLDANLRIQSAEDLAIHYIDSKLGHMPFPSYLYRRDKTVDLQMLFKEGNKHSDVSFLIKAVKNGPLLWLQEPIMLYRRHTGNDSANLDIYALNSLCRFLLRSTSIAPAVIESYKMKSYIIWYRQRIQGISRSVSPWRDRVIKKSSLTYALSNPKIILDFFVKKVLIRLRKLI